MHRATPPYTTDMKYLHIIQSLLIVATMWACQAKPGPQPTDDEQRDIIKRANDLSMTRPKEALALLDSAEQHHAMQPIDINAMRSVVYNNAQTANGKALKYAIMAANDTAIGRDPKKQLLITALLATEYYTCGSYDHSLLAAEKGIAMARKLKAPLQEASLLLTTALCESETGMVGKAMTTFDKGIKLMWRQTRLHGDWSSCSRLVELYSQKAGVMIDNAMYDSIVGMHHGFTLAIEAYRKCGYEKVKGSIDHANAWYYSAYAVAFQHTGDKKLAAEYFARLKATAYASRPEGYSMLLPYLMAEHRYGEAIALMDKEERMYVLTGRDTVDYHFVRTLLPYRTKALYCEGRYEEAAIQGQRAIALNDSLDRRIKAQGAQWISEALGTKAKDMKLHEQRKSLLITYSVVGVIVVILLVVLVLFIRVMSFNRIIRRKNIAATKAINDLIAYKEQLSYLLKSRQEKASDGGDGFDEDDHKMFMRLEQRIISEQLFLKPKLSRDDVIAILGISKNRFASLFTKYSGKSFNRYINDMRLDYAAEQLKKNTAYSVEAIAADCGIPVRQTFYRLFTEKFGLTPAEYRRLSADGGADE